jgi:serine/threonine protein kinase
MDSLNQPVLQACPECDTKIDVSDQEPFEQVHCPVCQTTIRARTQFNNFTLIDVLGSGGMGAVYRAFDQNLQRYVALKVVRREHISNPAHLASFEREARITAAVNHPNVVKVFSFGHDHGSFYIAMELVNKGSLDDLIQRHNMLPEAKALQIGLQIARGLRAANQLGLIHRDIKPGNILFADEHTAKIVDFGLATVLGRAAEDKGEVWGTPFYVSPERLKDQPEDFRSDIYSLGATLFHAIAGKPPYESTAISVSALRQIRSRPVSLLGVAPDVSSPTAAVIDRMLKENPLDRFQNYDELIDLLAYALGHLSPETTVPTHAPVAPRRSSGSSPLTKLLLVAALAGAGYWAKLHYRPAQSQEESPQSSSSTSADPLQDQYAEALGKISSGEYPAAIALLSQIQDSSSIKPKLLRWVLFQKGVAHLLARDSLEAQSTFAELAQKGAYSDAPGEKPLAKFLVDIGTIGSALNPPQVTPNSNPTASEALSWLVLGFKYYQIKDLDRSESLLTAYVQAAPEESFQPYLKLSDYKAACQTLLNEIQTRKSGSVAVQTTAAATPAEIASAEAKPAEAKPAEATSAEATPTPADQQAEATPFATPADDPVAKAELEKLLRVREKFAPAFAAYRFAEPQAEFSGLSFKTEAAQKKMAALLKMADWLSNFKKRLVADLEREGFPFSIKAANGGALEGAIGGASDKEVKLKTPYGVIPIEWSKLSPDSVSSMAIYFLKKEKDQAVFAERKWELGIYLCQFGRGKVGSPILTELAPSKPEYADSVDGILELTPQ